MLDLLHNLKTTKSQHQLTSVLNINLTLTLDEKCTLNFGQPMSQLKFNQISTSYNVTCLLCDILKGKQLHDFEINISNNLHTHVFFYLLSCKETQNECFKSILAGVNTCIVCYM